MSMKISEQKPLCPHYHNTPTKCDTFAAFLPSLGQGNFLELGVRGHRDLRYSIIVPLSVYGQRRVCLNPQMHIFAIGAIFLLCRYSACLPLCPEKTKTLEKCGSMGAHLPTAPFVHGPWVGRQSVQCNIRTHC